MNAALFLIIGCAVLIVGYIFYHPARRSARLSQLKSRKKRMEIVAFQYSYAMK